MILAGFFTGIISLCFHLFWKFKTANTPRARWKALFPIACFSREISAETSLESLNYLKFRSPRPQRKNYLFRSHPRRRFKQYQRNAA